MKKPVLLILASLFMLYSCGGGDSSSDSEEEEWKPIEVNMSNIMGKWTVRDDEGLANKDIAGTTVEFVQDSIYYTDENGNPQRKWIEFHEEWGPRIATVTIEEDSSVFTSTTKFSMNFHDTDTNKLNLYLSDLNVTLLRVK